MSIKKIHVLSGVLAISLTLIISGCVVPVPQRPAPPPMYVQQPPPPDIVEMQPPPPSESPYWVWQRGHWRWNGNAYQWHPGHWVARPPHYSQWVPPHWSPRNGGWVFIEGHWQ